MARTMEIARQVTYVTEMLGLRLMLLFFSPEPSQSGGDLLPINSAP